MDARTTVVLCSAAEFGDSDDDHTILRVVQVVGGFRRSIRYFHEEEELFFAPLVDEPQAKELVLRAVSDHLRLHALVRTVKRQISEGEADFDVLVEIADLLTDHVRIEEQELFPLVEELVPEDILKELAVSGRRDV